MGINVSPNIALHERARGDGVILRQPRWAEFEAWASLRRENQTHLEPWEPSWDEAHLSRNSYKARLARFKKLIAADEGYPFHIFRASDERFMGACNLIEVRRHVAQSAQIGYWLGEEYARNGLARAAVRAVVSFGFGKLGLHRIEAAVQPDNLRSVRLLEATGFNLEGRARGALKINGQWEDHDIYARLSSDG